MRILIIDDEPHIIRALSVLFNKTGYEVLSAYNGADGLAKLEAEQPDIAIVDIMMPGVNGLELLRIWRDRHPKTKAIQFIILTASCDENVIAYVQDFDNVRLVTKPFSPRNMLHFVREAASTNAARPSPV